MPYYEIIHAILCFISCPVTLRVHLATHSMHLTTLDDIDKRLLLLLQENAKYTHKELAAKLGLTTTPVYERVKRLEKDGYIKRYVAIVDRKMVHRALMVFCSITLKEHTKETLATFEKAARGLEEVLECYHIAGTSDYLLKICVKDIDAYHYFAMHKLVGISNIANVRSDFVMNEIKSHTSISV